MKKLLLFSAFLALFCSCGKKGAPLTATQVEEKLGPSIVLVKNEYYFVAETGDTKWYFTGIDENGDIENLETELADVKTATCFGTGFFISDDGKIATNCHVAMPSVSEKAVKESLSASFELLCDNATREITKLTDQINELHNYWLNVPSGSDLEASIERRREELKEEREEMQAFLNALRKFQTSDLKITPHCQIGIALNNTHVDNSSDFIDCVTLNSDADHDLAVLQLKSKRMPEGSTFIDIERYDESHELAPYNADGEYIDVDNPQLGEHLYLMGYNLGPTLAITDQGLKAQITEGSISQNTDDVQLMYTIPTLGGSSGSPVVDAYGNLICVNYAGLKSTQSFNYGIKAKHLRKLVK